MLRLALCVVLCLWSHLALSQDTEEARVSSCVNGAAARNEDVRYL